MGKSKGRMEKGNKEMTESEMQKLVFEWAKWNERIYPELKLMYHIANEGVRSYQQTAWLKAMGMKNGVPDICLPVRRGQYGGLFIELKTDKGRLRKEQEEWLEELKQYGNLAVVCRSVDEVIAVIKAYLTKDD